MTKIDSKSIEEYQKILAADPNSKVFAVLGEAYRELGLAEQAENILRRGIAKHPAYPAGYVALGKLLLQNQAHADAVKVLAKAVELAPDNLLAFQLLGETHLQMKNPKAALKSHKMALFLNPSNLRSQQVVKKLESLTADEFEEDLFEMKRTAELKEPSTQSPAAMTSAALERGLSVVDALIVRQETSMARSKLLDLQKLFPGDPLVRSRLEMIEADQDVEVPQNIKPLPAREKRLIEQKIQRLQAVLQVIEDRQDADL